MRHEARRIQMVFQDPFASLNPRRRAGELVAQGPMVHGASRQTALARAKDLFALVGLDPESADRYPHEFSGGQRQRIGLARALALDPEVLVADEPVSALDVSVQAQVLRLLADLRARLGLSMVFITHDLRVAAQICDRIAVMKNGVVVEEGPTAEVFARRRNTPTPRRCSRPSPAGIGHRRTCRTLPTWLRASDARRARPDLIACKDRGVTDGQTHPDHRAPAHRGRAPEGSLRDAVGALRQGRRQGA